MMGENMPVRLPWASDGTNKKFLRAANYSSPILIPKFSSTYAALSLGIKKRFRGGFLRFWNHQINQHKNQVRQ
jgi:hypothetical protein